MRIVRDEWGTPHVTAETEAEGFFGLGWAQADDDLPGVLRRLRTGRGDAAAAFGEESLASDLSVAQWMHAEESRAGFRRLEPGPRAALTAWTQGVHAYAAAHPSRVPAWAHAPEPWEVVAVSRTLLWWYMWLDAVASLRASGVEPELLLGATNAAGSASNQIAVGPSRTADGVAMLISDIHTGPDRKFEHTMRAGGLEFYGTSLLGCVLPVIGHNARVAWALTTGAPRVSDCFSVRTDPRRPDRWFLDGMAHDVMQREVSVQVAGGTEVRRVFEYIELDGLRCPVVAREDDHAFVVATPYQHRAETIDAALYGMLHSDTAAGATSVCRRTGFYPQNVMAADVNGGLSYARVGLVPRRPDDVDASRPIPASRGTLWRGLRHPDELLHVDDPANGWMQNCNAAPDRLLGGAFDPRIDATTVPRDAFNDRPGRTTSRADRAADLVAEAHRLTTEDWLAVALDELWIDVPAWQRVLEPGHGGSGLDALVPAQAVELLRSFDGQARSDSPAAHLWLRWRERLAAADEPSERLASIHEQVLAGSVLDRDDRALVMRHLADAVAEIEGRHGTLDVPLGAVFRLGEGASEVPVGGAAYEAHPSRAADDSERLIAPLRVMLPGPPDGTGVRQPAVGGFNLVVSVLSQPIRSWSAVLPGQSGDPGSPHHQDRLALLRERRVRPTCFHPDDLSHHATTDIDVPAPVGVPHAAG